MKRFRLAVEWRPLLIDSQMRIDERRTPRSVVELATDVTVLRDVPLSVSLRVLFRPDDLVRRQSPFPHG
jgi:hypothetical protein